MCWRFCHGKHERLGQLRCAGRPDTLACVVVSKLKVPREDLWPAGHIRLSYSNARCLLSNWCGAMVSTRSNLAGWLSAVRKIFTMAAALCNSGGSRAYPAICYSAICRSPTDPPAQLDPDYIEEKFIDGKPRITRRKHDSKGDDKLSSKVKAMISPHPTQRR